MIVVGCGKRKLDRSAPARELYTGSLFVMARRYAEASGKPWVILSAAHGVVDPAVILRPYDQELPDKGEALRHWARKAALQIELFRAQHLADVLVGEPVEILAGVRYGAPLAAALEHIDIESRQPLRGLGVGRRLCRLRQMMEEKRGSGSRVQGAGSEGGSGLKP